MKVIDLLVDKVNGKQLPNKIKANGIVFILDKENKEYKREDGNAEEFYTDYMIDGFVDLTDEVEVIEEDKKIRKITLLGEEVKLGLVSNWLKDSTNNEEKIASCIECNAMKINEIIDYINGGTNGE